MAEPVSLSSVVGISTCCSWHCIKFKPCLSIFNPKKNPEAAKLLCLGSLSKAFNWVPHFPSRHHSYSLSGLRWSTNGFFSCMLASGSAPASLMPFHVSSSAAALTLLFPLLYAVSLDLWRWNACYIASCFECWQQPSFVWRQHILSISLHKFSGRLMPGVSNASGIHSGLWGRF